jgi:hypothetical protein
MPFLPAMEMAARKQVIACRDLAESDMACTGPAQVPAIIQARAQSILKVGEEFGAPPAPCQVLKDWVVNQTRMIAFSMATAHDVTIDSVYRDHPSVRALRNRPLAAPAAIPGFPGPPMNALEVGLPSEPDTASPPGEDLDAKIIRLRDYRGAVHLRIQDLQEVFDRVDNQLREIDDAYPHGYRPSASERHRLDEEARARALASQPGNALDLNEQRDEQPGVLPATEVQATADAPPGHGGTSQMAIAAPAAAPAAPSGGATAAEAAAGSSQPSNNKSEGAAVGAPAGGAPTGSPIPPQVDPVDSTGGGTPSGAVPPQQEPNKDGKRQRIDYSIPPPPPI